MTRMHRKASALHDLREVSIVLSIYQALNLRMLARKIEKCFNRGGLYSGLWRIERLPLVRPRLRLSLGPHSTAGPLGVRTATSACLLSIAGCHRLGSPFSPAADKIRFAGLANRKISALRKAVPPSSWIPLPNVPF